MSANDLYNVQCLEMFFRQRVHPRLVSDEIRHTPCVVDVDPRHTICRNLPVGNVVTLLSVRESVSNRLEFKNLCFFVTFSSLAFFPTKEEYCVILQCLELFLKLTLI